jgi:hypothetical protein
MIKRIITMAIRGAIAAIREPPCFWTKLPTVEHIQRILSNCSQAAFL